MKLLDKIKCQFNYHDFREIQKFRIYRVLRCERCGLEIGQMLSSRGWADNMDVEFTRYLLRLL